MKVLIVDDHPLIREGLASVLGEFDPPPEVLEAEDAATAQAAAAATSDLQLILLDLMVPGAHDLTLLHALRHARQDVPVVVVSANDNREQVRAAIEAGAMGFISKRSATAVLVSAIRLVLAGGVYVPPHVLSGVDAPAVSALPVGREHRIPADIGLTDRQADVLVLMVQGFTNKMICRQLGLAEGTVKTHISAILKALGVVNRTQALFALSSLRMQLAPPTARLPARLDFTA